MVRWTPVPVSIHHTPRFKISEAPLAFFRLRCSEIDLTLLEYSLDLLTEHDFRDVEFAEELGLFGGGKRGHGWLWANRLSSFTSSLLIFQDTLMQGNQGRFVPT